MKATLFSIIIILTSLYLNGQKNDYVWLMCGSSKNFIWINDQWGTTIADFGRLPVEFRYDSLITMDFSGTDASISDNDGNLLMYSNGMHVHNGMHTPIIDMDTIGYGTYWENFNESNYYPDGSGWKTGFPVLQSVLMLPKPSSEDYHFYYSKWLNDPNDMYNFHRIVGLYEARVRFDATSPTGRLVYKDKQVINGNFQSGFTAHRHANGRDWWLVMTEEFNIGMQIWLLDPYGLHYKYYNADTRKAAELFTWQYSSFSPDGKLFVSADGDRTTGEDLYVSIYTFNSCTGEMNLKELKNLGKRWFLYGCLSFSPDGRYLYVTDGRNMYQYDTEAERILDSGQLIAISDGSIYQPWPHIPGIEILFSSLITAPDGKIYCIAPGNMRAVHTIEYPEEAGTEATVRQNAITLPTTNFNAVPNFANFRVGPVDGSPCDTLGLDNHPIAKFRYEQDTLDNTNIRFTDLSYFRPETWTWDFGDGTTFNGRKPYWHQYAQSGTYTVCLTVSNENSTHTECQQIIIGGVGTDDGNGIAKGITIFPNPTDGDIIVRIGDYVPEAGIVIIHDQMGKELLSKSVYYGNNTINVRSLPPGLYVCTIKDTHGTLRQQKIVKL